MGAQVRVRGQRSRRRVAIVAGGALALTAGHRLLRQPARHERGDRNRANPSSTGGSTDRPDGAPHGHRDQRIEPAPVALAHQVTGHQQQHRDVEENAQPIPVPPPSDVTTKQEPSGTPGDLYDGSRFSTRRSGDLNAGVELLGAWVCYPCEQVLDLLSTGDKRDREFETVCPKCGKQGTFRPRPVTNIVA